MTMSRDIKHTKSATQATKHTENNNPDENNIEYLYLLNRNIQPLMFEFAHMQGHV